MQRNRRPHTMLQDAAPLESDAGAPLLADAYDSLRGLQELGADWDPYGSQPPSVVALEVAKSFLHLAETTYAGRYGDQLRPSFIAPISDGGVHMEWEQPGGDLSLAFGPNGNIGFLLVGDPNDPTKASEGDRITRDSALQLLSKVLGAAKSE